VIITRSNSYGSAAMPGTRKMSAATRWRLPPLPEKAYSWMKDMNKPLVDDQFF
jgi:hypothetical protein